MPQLVSLQFVQLAQGVEADPANLAVQAFRIGGVEHRVPLGPTLHALINRGQKAVAKRVLSPVRLHPAGDQHDEAGQVFVLCAQSVGDPCAQ